jgi:hypothetical protein
MEGEVLHNVQVDMQPVVAQGPLATARPVMVLVVVFPVRICDGQKSLLGDLTRI